MLKNTLLAAACVAALSIAAPLSTAYAVEGTTELSASEQQALDAQVLAVEGLVETYKDDAAGLQAAIEALVTDAANPELAATAVLIVFDNSQNPKILAILANNSALKAAAGNGLGAAIVALGITNPDLAAKVSAIVAGSGDAEMIAAAQSGADTKTASINRQRKENRERAAADGTTGDSTPENDLSPTTI
tara:strand:- start:4175 stop:4744 length:570 start_codon:yes stop_codon:yes gene_type:complete